MERARCRPAENSFLSGDNFRVRCCLRRRRRRRPCGRFITRSSTRTRTSTRHRIICVNKSAYDASRGRASLCGGGGGRAAAAKSVRRACYYYYCTINPRPRARFLQRRRCGRAHSHARTSSRRL